MQTKTLLSRAGIAVVAALALSAVGGMPALADDLTPTVSVDPTTVCLGHPFTISGTGQASGTYEVSIANVQNTSLIDAAQQVSVDVDGSFTSPLTALASAPAGAYQAVFTPADPALGTSFSTPVVADSCRVASAVPTIAGSVAVGSTLTALPGEWDPAATLTYQWFADGTPVVNETATALVIGSALEGKQITVAVTGAMDLRDPDTQTSAPTAKVIRTSTPTISGTPVVGQTLTAKPGTWTTASTLKYQWKAADAAISGATSTTFKPTAAQDGKRITVTVTGSKTGYSTEQRTSTATALVMRPATPKITGYAAVGLTLKATAGTWSSGTAFAYRWYANGTAVAGATSSTFKPSASQRDKRIMVKVTGKKSGYPTVTVGSASTAKVTLSGSTSISGTPLYGKTLSAHHGTWAAGTSLAYRWYQNGVAISGATKSTLVLGASLKNKNISVRITGRKSGYATVVRSSASTLKVATASTPTIAGTRQVSKTLTAHTGAWTSGTTFSFQWYAAGKAISGATHSTLKLSSGTKGKHISVKVVGRKSGYPTITKLSAQTGLVAAAPRQCDPNYAWACVPIASDVDCLGGSGNGPAYVKGPVLVIGRDIYHLDSDGDGVGCE